MQDLRLCIRPNSKVRYPCLSHLPIVTCAPDAPCHKCGWCYALKFIRSRFVPKHNNGGPLRAWSRNTEIWMLHPGDFYELVIDYLARRSSLGKDPFFRWHSAGDVPDAEYWWMMCRVARLNKGTRFLVFTKQFSTLREVRKEIPKNLQVVLSMWPGWRPNLKGLDRFARAWMQDGTETRIPSTAFKCRHRCDKHCTACWDLASGSHDVVFHKH